MKKFRRGTAMLLTLAVLLSALGIIAGAAGSSVVIEATDAHGSPGEIVEVDINLKENPGCVSLMIDTEFDSSVLQLVEIVDTEAFPGGMHHELDAHPNSFRFTWENDTNAEENLTTVGTIATMKFKILDGAAAGQSYPVTLSIPTHGVLNHGGNEVDAVIEKDGTVTVEEGSGGGGDESDSNPTFSVDTIKVNKFNQTVDVSINVSNNPGIIGATLYVNYDSSFVVQSIEKGTLGLSSLTFAGPATDAINNNPIKLNWDGEVNDTSEGEIVRITFELPENLEAGIYPIELSMVQGEIVQWGDDDFVDLEPVFVNGHIEIVDFTYGDVNNDGNINIKDVVLVRKYNAGHNVVQDSGFIVEAADVNLDGSVNIKDVVLIRKYNAGHNVTLGK